MLRRSGWTACFVWFGYMVTKAMAEADANGVLKRPPQDWVVLNAYLIDVYATFQSEEEGGGLAPRGSSLLMRFGG